MRRASFSLVLAAALTLAAGWALAAPPAIALVHGRIVRVSAPTIPDGTVLIENGKIAAVGARVAVPGGARVIDVRGLSVYPGLLDANTTLGIQLVPEGEPGTMDTQEVGDFNPAEQAGVAVNPWNEIIPTVRTNGITDALTAMRGGTIAGQASLIQLAGWTSDQMSVRRGAALWVNFPPQQGGGGRGAFARLLSGQGPPSAEEREREYRRRLDALRDYFDRARLYAGAQHTPEDGNVELDAMIPYVTGKLPVVFVVNRVDDIRAAIQFGESEHLHYVLAGAKDAWLALGLIKQHNVPIIYGPLTTLPNSENDPYDVVYSTPAALWKNGAPFCIASGSATDSRNLPQNAALAEAYGLPAEEALKAVTLYPAQILGVADQLGSIDAGKRADLFVATGDPLDLRTEIKYLFIGGEQVPLVDKGTELFQKFMARPDKISY